MWEHKFGRIRIHGGSSTSPYRTKNFFSRSKHFAIESPWYYLHLATHNNRHTDRTPTIEMFGEKYKAYQLSGSGLPDKYRGNLSLSFVTSLGRRLHTSHHFNFDYGGLTSDWREIEKANHKRVCDEG